CPVPTVYQIAQNGWLANWTVEDPIPDYWSPEFLGKPPAKDDVFALLEQLKKDHQNTLTLAGHAQATNEVSGNPCGSRKFLAGHPCGSPNQMAKLAAITIPEMFIIGRHFMELLDTREERSRIAIAKKYGISPTWVVNAVDLLKLPKSLQNYLDSLIGIEDAPLFPKKMMIAITLMKSPDEQIDAFKKLVE
ncbi:MAG: hypothetical protein HQL69_22430, partial [Magnetococcales bacterium]|nr:hypothetical protein [Magnetococcales bacterium]